MGMWRRRRSVHSLSRNSPLLLTAISELANLASDYPAIFPRTEDKPAGCALPSASFRSPLVLPASPPKQHPNCTHHRMHLSDLKNLHVTELVDMAMKNEIEGANRLRKQELIFAL